MAVDAGLRAFMLGVYNKVALGLVLSAALAWVTGMYQPTRALLFRVDGAGRIGYTILGMIVAFAPLADPAVPGLRAPATPQSGRLHLLGGGVADRRVARHDLPALQRRGHLPDVPGHRGAFGGLSLVGYTTKRDLTGMGSFLIMGCGA